MVDLLRDRGELQTENGILGVCGLQIKANITDGVSDLPEGEPTGAASSTA